MSTMEGETPRGRPMPSLGYPSRTAAVHALRAGGMGYREIAARVGITPAQVNSLLSHTPVPRADLRPAAPARSAPPPEDFVVRGVLKRVGRASIEPMRASEARGSRETQARVRVRFRLRGADGRWVRMDLDGFVDDEAHAWIGFAHHLAVVRKREEFAGLEVVEVPPEARAFTFSPFGGSR